MTYHTRFACQVGTTDPAGQIGLEIWLDDLQIYNQDSITATETVMYEFPEAEAEHLLRFVVKNKSPDSTVLNSDGEIVGDVCATVKNITFDDIAVDQVFTDLAVYQHDFNGTQDTVNAKFYGELGCNGTVTMQFSTPIYLWLLEHM